MPTRRLATFIEANRERIVGRWLDAAAPESAQAGTSRLGTGVGAFVDELVRALYARAGDGGAVEPRSAIAKAHGAIRFHDGADIETTVRDYGLLRDVVLEMMDESSESFSLADVRMLASIVTHAIASAVGEYARAHDARMRDQSARHAAFLAHELRNPLGSARLAFSALVRRGAVSVEDPFVRSIERGLRRLGDLIDDALIAAKLEAGRAPEREEVVAGDVLAEVLADVEADVAAKGLAVRLTGDTAARFAADRKLLGSCLSNLIRNAVKFTHDGTTVAVSVRASSGRVAFDVADSCGGLGGGGADRLFSPFSQAGRDRSGFGLGLAIARQAAEAHGGSLTVRDVPGNGCVFTAEFLNDGAP